MIISFAVIPSAFRVCCLFFIASTCLQCPKRWWTREATSSHKPKLCRVLIWVYLFCQNIHISFSCCVAWMPTWHLKTFHRCNIEYCAYSLPLKNNAPTTTLTYQKPDDFERGSTSRWQILRLLSGMIESFWINKTSHSVDNTAYAFYFGRARYIQHVNEAVLCVTWRTGGIVSWFWPEYEHNWLHASWIMKKLG